MKLIKRLILVLILLFALSMGTFYWWSVENSPPDPLNLHQPAAGLSPKTMNAMAGLYRDGDGRRMLLLPSARGGLLLVHADDFSLSHEQYAIKQLIYGKDKEWWVETHDGRTQAVELFGRGGQVSAIRWPDYVISRIESPAFDVVAVEYSNEVPLSGTMFLPNTNKPVPGAVIIHGSGTSDRDGLWYLLVARTLAENGVAVLLPDKRGSGRSGGEWRTASFDDFARDALAAAKILQERPEVANGHVGMVGMSQGGRIAPIAALMTDDVAFAVNIASAAVTPNDQVRHEIRQQLMDEGVPAQLTPLLLPIAAQMPARRRPAWWQMNGDIDPLDAWQRLDRPGLVFYGAEDEKDNVPVKQSVDRLRSLGKADSELRIVVLPDVGHSLVDPKSGELHPEFRRQLPDWIHGISNIPEAVQSCTGVPLVIGDFMVAEVQLDELQARLALDPGRSLYIDSGFADKSGIRLMSAKDVRYDGTVSINNSAPQVPSFAPGLVLDIGGQQQQVPAALVIDIQGLGERYAGIDGLLGASVFKDHVLDIDLPGHCMHLIPRDEFTPPSNPMVVKRRNDRPVIDGAIEFPDGQGFDALFLLDFGLRDTLLLEKAFVDAKGLAESRQKLKPEQMATDAQGEMKSFTAEALMVSVGTSIWTDTAVRFSREQEETVTPPWDGRIGLGLLGTRRIIYDPVESRLWMLEPGTEPAE